MFEVSSRLGHANLSTTADTYGHVTPTALVTRLLADHDRLEDTVACAARAAAINRTRAGVEPPTRKEMGLA